MTTTIWFIELCKTTANGGNQEYRVVGIIKDFNFETLHQLIRSVVIMHEREFISFRFFSVKLNPGDIAMRIQEIEHAWHQTFPDDAFVGSFVDERIQQRYKTELQLKKAATLASVLMLVIVMTGVLGLVALSVARRTKEIGIRKVLGAMATEILKLIRQGVRYRYDVVVRGCSSTELCFYKSMDE